MVLGFLFAIPWLILWTGRLAGTLPTLSRIATRDVARHARQAGAALAAATIALAVPIGFATITLADEARARPVPYMASDQLRVDAYGTAGVNARAIGRALVTLRSAFPEASISEVLPASVRAKSRTNEGGFIVVKAGSPGGSQGNPLLMVGGAELLRAFHAEGGIDALRGGAIVGIGPGTVGEGTVDLYREGNVGSSLFLEGAKAVEAGEKRWSALGLGGEFNFVVSPDRARELGLRPTRDAQYPNSLLFRAPAPLTAEDVTQVRQVLRSDRTLGVTTLTDLDVSSGSKRVALSIVGMSIALAVVAVIVALLAAESRRDRAILVAVGAGPRSRRLVSGLYAGVVGALATLLAVLAGFVPARVFLEGQSPTYPFVVPWGVLGVVLIGVPGVAGLVGVAFSREPKASQLLRPLA
jgi:putative ABC transport system permease protein